MNPEMIAALKVAVARTLLLAGILIVVYGAANVGTGMLDPIYAARVPVGLITMAEGIVLLAFSRLVPLKP